MPTLTEIAHPKDTQAAKLIGHQRSIQRTVKKLRREGKMVQFTKQSGVPVKPKNTSSGKMANELENVLKDC